VSGEFKKRIETLRLDNISEKKVLDIIKEAGDEYACLVCPSKDTCENFNWYVKWFSE
jgi:hypothetical protein